MSHKIYNGKSGPQVHNLKDMNDHPFCISKHQQREMNNHPGRDYVAVSSFHQLRVFEKDMIFCYDVHGRQTIVLTRGRASS
jgi:hypothetical protein